MASAATSDELVDEQLAETVAMGRNSPAQYEHGRRAFEELYRRHAGRLLGFLAARVHRSDLEDVNQVVWQRVWERLPDSFHGGNFRAWLHQIARNYLIDQSRRPQLRLIGEEAGALVDDKRSDDVVLQQERTRILEGCLKRLETRSAQLVRSRLGGESYDEICVRLELEPARAHKLFHEAKSQLSDCVQRASQ